MAPTVSRLGTAFLKRQEWVAQIDEGRTSALAPQFEIEQSTIEGQSLSDITDFKGYVVETNGTRFFCVIHSALLWVS
jgi:hypothetical protein